jgi:iron complex outermembrane receptor protein
MPVFRPHLSRSLLVTALACALSSQTAIAAEANDDSVFVLGKLEVFGNRELPVETHAEIMSAEKIELLHRQTLATALSTLPGVTLNGVAGRNELGVYVRGFDLRQVPLFIDGIPVYVPYDGYVDLGRFTTFDVGQVNVAKGFSSVLYGPNALGGAINVVSRRPQRAFEADVTAEGFSGDGYRFSTNLGGKTARWYGQLGASVIEQDYYELSDDFKPVGPTEDGGHRENSYRTDRKLSAKVGYTPTDSDEYALGFSIQEGEKGTPPYAGTDPSVRARYWRWPQWDKTSVYFISSTALGAESYVKPRFFYDTFQNQLYAYDNATYTTQRLGSSFQSIYDDYTYGGSLEFGTTLLTKQTLKFAGHYKEDVHREHNVGSPETHFRDRTWSLAVEDTLKASSLFTLVGGLSYEGRESLEAQNLVGNVVTDFPGNKNDTVNPQLGLFYTPSANTTLEASIARKSRFPTVKDRYSYRLGQAIPNPALEPESALHYEIAYRGRPHEHLTLQASLFLAQIDDTIQRVDRVAFAANGSPLFQLQNVGESEHRGIELGGDYSPFAWLRGGASYTYLKRENKTNPMIRLIDTPEHKVFAFVEVKPLAALSVTTSYEYNSSRFSTSTGIEAGSYSLMNLTATYTLPHGFSVGAGVNNLFDRNYQLTEGYPEEGRNAFVNLTYRY